LELGEIKDLIPKFHGVKHLPKFANDSFLSYNYGWVPFISDLKALASVYSSVTNRLDYLRKTKGKVTRVHYQRKDLLVPVDNTTAHDAGDYLYRYRFASYRYTFIGSGLLYQNLENIDGAWATWRGLIAGLGFNNPAKIIWNAIPFSFLIDYIVPVSNWLSTWGVKPFVGAWDLYDLSYSLKCESKIDIDFCYYDTTRNSPINIGYIDVNKYIRGVGLPTSLSDLLDSVDFGNLTTTQQALCVALFLGNTVLR
jgi:hypothetical protein